MNEPLYVVSAKFLSRVVAILGTGATVRLRGFTSVEVFHEWGGKRSEWRDFKADTLVGAMKKAYKAVEEAP
jgi:hypothetical protein